MPRKALDRQIDKIRRDILEMSELVSDAVLKAITALENNDKKMANEVIIGDELIDNYYTHIKKRVIQTIALHQPVAKDLRFISISLDVAYNLERIGDYARDIAESLDYMNKGYFVLDEISEMGRISSQMSGDAADVFVNENRENIDEILKKEDRVDELYKSVFPTLKNIIEKKYEKYPDALNLILIAKFLERIADHSVNIANRAMYEMSGEEEYL
ncbi:MAG: phosphate transport system regulatory protein PhoU [Candidatus Altiarchaeales archaeon]|nr:MAG: phosphate transport system regulatory protein PhoU [Candidatus Altiarchaeales archaeon]